MSQKVYTFTTGPHKNLASPGPATPEEFDAAAGQGKCLEGAMADAIYRGHLPSLHDLFVPIYEKHTGNKQLVDKKKTDAAKVKAKDGEKVSDVLETPVTFMDREYELASPEVKAAIDADVRAVAATTFIDVSPTRRESGPGKANLERAAQILTRDADAIEAAVATIAARVPGFDPSRDASGKPVVEDLARGIKAMLDEAARAATAGL